MKGTGAHYGGSGAHHRGVRCFGTEEEARLTEARDMRGGGAGSHAHLPSGGRWTTDWSREGARWTTDWFREGERAPGGQLIDSQRARVRQMDN